MRQHPIGTGPFKFVEFKPNEYVKVARNSDYWRNGRPYLDGIEYTVIPNRSTAMLSFIAGKFDMTFPFEGTVPLPRDVKAQAPEAICELVPANASANLIINRDAPSFDNPVMRRALALALDRKAFIDILTEGKGDVGGAMQPLPEGVLGMPPDMLKSLPGYDPDVQRNRVEARAIMEKFGYGPDKRLEVKVSERNIAIFRDPADHPDRPAQRDLHRWQTRPDRDRQLVSQNLSQKITRSASISLGSELMTLMHSSMRTTPAARSVTTPGIAVPSCKKMFEQSMEADQEKRRRLVWEIDRRLQEDQARPIVYHLRFAACWQNRVKGLRMMVNSVFNGSRFEDVWLDK